MKKGFFISFEGTDGCGKTTQTRLAQKYLCEENFDVLLLREPGGTGIGEKIRKIILDNENVEMAHSTEMLLYAASRAQLVSEIIIPAIDSGKIVICDRFLDSSLVYQGVARGIGIENAFVINNYATGGLLPDITFFIDVPPALSLKRRIDETPADRLETEGISLQKMVYNAYKEIAGKYNERIKVIDGTRSVEEVFKDIEFWMKKLTED